MALLTASLLQEESSTLHHKETLTQAANKWKRKVTKLETHYNVFHVLRKRRTFTAITLDRKRPNSKKKKEPQQMGLVQFEGTNEITINH